MIIIFRTNFVIKIKKQYIIINNDSIPGIPAYILALESSKV